jgi:hypothetical protein
MIVTLDYGRVFTPDHGVSILTYVNILAGNSIFLSAILCRRWYVITHFLENFQLFLDYGVAMLACQYPNSQRGNILLILMC